MELQAIYQLPKQPCKDFQPVQQMKKLMLELLKHNANIVFHPLENDNDLLYPQHNPFPMKEKEFTTYFFIHPIPKQSIYCNSVIIGCHLLSTKSIKQLKASTTEEIPLMDWLKINKIYLEADTLSCKTIHTLGYLFFLHPQITHHVLLKGILQEAIMDVKLTKDEAKAINPTALDYYSYTNSADQANAMSDQAQDEYNTDDLKLVPIPFKLYHTDVGYRTGMARVATKAIGIKSNVEYSKLLNELLLHMQVGKHIFPSMKYISVGLAANIGAASYTQLICNNNAYPASITLILVLGISNRSLNYTIPVTTDKGTDEPCTICKVIMDMEWCLQIEPTQVPG